MEEASFDVIEPHHGCTWERGTTQAIEVRGVRSALDRMSTSRREKAETSQVDMVEETYRHGQTNREKEILIQC